MGGADTWVLDAVLVAMLVAAVVNGFRSGLLRSVGTLAGLAAGALAVALYAPGISDLVGSTWRLPVLVVVSVSLLLLGRALGRWMFSTIGTPIRRTRLRPVDSILGALGSAVALCLAVQLVAGGLVSLGAPAISSAIGTSRILSALNRATPSSVQAWLAQVRAQAIDQAMPELPGVLIDPGSIEPVPDAPGTEAVRAASDSVVRIVGDADRCSQVQSGSGFAFDDSLVMTNAHVVAAVDRPLVQTSDGLESLPGTVVLFDPDLDVAVIRVDGLDVEPLSFADTDLTAGQTAAVAGYPYGGPFSLGGARVISRATEQVSDIYGDRSAPRDVYAVSARVQPGNSGGPLLTEDGTVGGVVFAKGTDSDSVGYAIASDAVRGAAETALRSTAAVGTGACITD